jgi:hypothetical protein
MDEGMSKEQASLSCDISILELFKRRLLFSPDAKAEARSRKEIELTAIPFIGGLNGVASAFCLVFANAVSSD